jgi:hypothetical protein
MTYKNRTSVYIDEPYIVKLERIAQKNQRTIVGQLRFWIDKEDMK